ncbi:MAG TPA: hypothetical protein VK808_03450 [Bacteroidia bacterium]|jgi:hypothetical protein|nr:hypothetical protein [Bacteroidia bacterium]
MEKKKVSAKGVAKILKHLKTINSQLPGHVSKVTFRPIDEISQQFNEALTNSGNGHLTVKNLQLSRSNRKCLKYEHTIDEDGNMGELVCVKWDDSDL